MPTFLGVPIIAPVIEDWTPDRAYETASGVSRIVTGDSHRFDLSFTLMDVAGRYRMASRLKSHYSKNRGVGFNIPMLQELYQDITGANEHGTYSPDLRLTAVAATDGGANSVRVRSATAGFLPEGWYVRFANHQKLYRLVADATWPTLRAEADLSLYPALRKDVPGNTVLSATPDYACRYDPSSPLLVTNGARGVSTASVRLVEDI